MNRQLDDVNHTLNESQKNINSVKSLFGGLKNKFGLKNKSPKEKKLEDKSLSKSFSNSKTFDQKQQQQYQQHQPKAEEFAKISGSDREVEINKNLEEMSMGLTRLTNLAKGMSYEMDRQNPIIDNIGTKVGNTDERIKNQNKQMNKVLK